MMTDYTVYTILCSLLCYLVTSVLYQKNLALFPADFYRNRFELANLAKSDLDWIWKYKSDATLVVCYFVMS